MTSVAKALVDSRLLASLPKYNNMRSEWNLFKFTLTTHLGAVSGKLLRCAARTQMTEKWQTNVQIQMDILAN